MTRTKNNIFDAEFLSAVLADWNYKEIYMDGTCVYSVTQDVSITVSDILNKLKDIHKHEIGTVYWHSVEVLPYPDEHRDGVILSFRTETKLW